MHKLLKCAIIAFALCLISITGNLFAATPKTINFQGRLLDAAGAPVADTFLFVVYRIYDAPTGGNILWDSGLESFITQDGLFWATLGSNSTFPLPLSVFADSGRYLGISIGGDGEMAPRIHLGSAPFTHVSGTVTDNSIATNNIITFTIANNDIADGAVESLITQDNSLRAIDFLNEPGVTSRNTGASVTLSSTVSDITTTTISIPLPGYIFLMAKANVTLSGTKLANTVVLRIDETAGGAGLTSQSVRVGDDNYSTNGAHTWPFGIQRVYFKSVGTFTFRLKGYKETANGTATVDSPTLTALYIPTSYGTVQTVSQNSGDNPDAQQIELTDESGANLEKAWLGDLRYYELKAKAAQEEALRAESELRKARAQGNK